MDLFKKKKIKDLDKRITKIEQEICDHKTKTINEYVNDRSGIRHTINKVYELVCCDCGKTLERLVTRHNPTFWEEKLLDMVKKL